MNSKKLKEELRARYPEDFPIPPDKINQEKLELILEQELTEWKIVRSPLPEDPYITREELYREYIFKDFDKVLEFMLKVSKICNTLPHHPRWENTWTTLKVYLTTWDSTHIISYKDVMLARHMEQAYLNYDDHAANAHQVIRIEKEKRKFFRKINAEISKGDLEGAFNKLSQYLVKPGEKADYEQIFKLSQDFNEFIKQTRTQSLSVNQLNEKTNYFKDELVKLVSTFEYIPKIFFSYAWGGEREQMVDQLYESLKSDGKYEVIRDKVDLAYKGLISEFMKEIGRGNFVVIALSDKYLKSQYCMHELYELYRNSFLENAQLLKKIYPIKVENIQLDDPKVLREYFEYWNAQESDWQELVNKYQADQGKHKMIKSIRNSLPDLLSFLADINTATYELLSEDDFGLIKNSIDSKVEALNKED